MRPIKFRVFNKTLGKMVYSDEFDYLSFFFNFVEDMKEFGNDVSDLMQFTGLQDEESNDMYEGDIVLTVNNKHALVDFINGCFVLHGDEGRELVCNACSMEEVIGNKYETPKLWEQTK